MDREEKRIDTATDAVRQQITLATAIIGVTLAFSDQVSGVKQGQVWSLLPWAFAPLVLVIVSGVLALMSIAYHLGEEGDPLAQRGVRFLGVTQNISFLVSVIAMVLIIGAT